MKLTLDTAKKIVELSQKQEEIQLFLAQSNGLSMKPLWTDLVPAARSFLDGYDARTTGYLEVK